MLLSWYEIGVIYVRYFTDPREFARDLDLHENWKGKLLADMCISYEWKCIARRFRSCFKQFIIYLDLLMTVYKLLFLTVFFSKNFGYRSKNWEISGSEFMFYVLLQRWEQPTMNRVNINTNKHWIRVEEYNLVDSSYTYSRCFIDTACFR